MLLETTENFMDDLVVFLESGASYEYIIQVNCNFTLGNEVSKDGVH